MLELQLIILKQKWLNAFFDLLSKIHYLKNIFKVSYDQNFSLLNVKRCRKTYWCLNYFCRITCSSATKCQLWNMVLLSLVYCANKRQTAVFDLHSIDLHCCAKIKGSICLLYIEVNKTLHFAFVEYIPKSIACVMCMHIISNNTLSNSCYLQSNRRVPFTPEFGVRFPVSAVWK